jgi:hypothetical protein
MTYSAHLLHSQAQSANRGNPMQTGNRGIGPPKIAQENRCSTLECLNLLPLQIRGSLQLLAREQSVILGQYLDGLGRWGHAGQPGAKMQGNRGWKSYLQERYKRKETGCLSTPPRQLEIVQFLGCRERLGLESPRQSETSWPNTLPETGI